MSAEIETETASPATLIAGAGGVFDVRQDGTLLFSKHSTGRFPREGEIAGLLRKD